MCAGMTAFCDQQFLTGRSAPFTSYLLHLPVLLCYNPCKLLSAGADQKHEHPFIGGQSNAEMHYAATHRHTTSQLCLILVTMESYAERMIKLPLISTGHSSLERKRHYLSEQGRFCLVLLSHLIFPKAISTPPLKRFPTATTSSLKKLLFCARKILFYAFIYLICVRSWTNIFFAFLGSSRACKMKAGFCWNCTMKHKSTPNFREFCREKIGSETTLKNAHFCNALKPSLLLPKLHF